MRRVELDEKGCIDLVTFRTSWEWHMPDHLSNGGNVDLPSLYQALLLFSSFQPDLLCGGSWAVERGIHLLVGFVIWLGLHLSLGLLKYK